MDERPVLIKGGFAQDDRGTVRFVNTFDFAGVKRFYVLENWKPYFVRAWHGHLHERKWITVLRGAAVVCAVSLDLIDWVKGGMTIEPPIRSVHKFILTENEPAVLVVPPNYANGSMPLIADTQVMHFSSMTLEETKGDDLRWPWDHIPGVWESQQR